MKSTIFRFEREFLQGKRLRIDNKKGNTSYEKHWHNYYELIYYCGCEGVCILNGEKYQLTERCIFLLTPKDFHEIITSDNENSESFIISFNDQIVDNSLSPFFACGPFFVPKLNDTTDTLIRELYECYQKDSLYQKQYQNHIFNCILIYILENGNSLQSGSRDIHPLVQQSISIMMENPTDQFTLESISKMLFINPSYFSHLFHNSTGIPFKKYLTMLRMEYAKRLLEENKLPIIDIGYECGYNTPSQFIRAFKAFSGITPSVYRKNYKE